MLKAKTIQYSSIFTLLLLCFFALLFPRAQLNIFETKYTFHTNNKPSFNLSIPSIGIHKAFVESVGISEKGAMEVPSEAYTVGWYNFGAIPGQKGSAVLAGHVNWLGGKDAVFTNLHQVKIGDLIEIENNFGRKNYFIVRAIEEYPTDSNTESVFSSFDGKSYLNLITCSGVWNEKSGTHESRLVVFSEKIH